MENSWGSATILEVDTNTEKNFLESSRPARLHRRPDKREYSPGPSQQTKVSIYAFTKTVWMMTGREQRQFEGKHNWKPERRWAIGALICVVLGGKWWLFDSYELAR